MLRYIGSLCVPGLFCWFLVSSLWIYPHNLSYFNESIGGPLCGPQHLLGSNLDWGQDLRYLLWDDVRSRHITYYGGFDPAFVAPSFAPKQTRQEGAHGGDTFASARYGEQLYRSVNALYDESGPFLHPSGPGRLPPTLSRKLSSSGRGPFKRYGYSIVVHSLEE